MPEEQSLVVELFRAHRPWRTAATIGLLTVGFVSVAGVRRHMLREESLDAWAARSAVIARLTSTTATSWVRARQADTRLLAASASRSPQIFGVTSADHPAMTHAKLVESLARSLTMINQLHGYTAIWLFDLNGKVVATTSSIAPPDAVRFAALESLAADSGGAYGPFRANAKDLSIAFAQRVAMVPAKTGAGVSAMSGTVMGAVVLTSDATPLLAEMATWTERSRTDVTSLVAGLNDSIHEYAMTPDRARGTLRGAWQLRNAPHRTRAIFAQRADTTAAIVGSRVEFAARIPGLPWAFVRGETTDAVFAAVDGRLGTEASTAAAVLFMIAIVVIARGQTVRDRKLIEVAESEVRYRLLADNATDVIIRHAPDGRIVYISPAVVTILGYQPRQLQGRYPAELCHAGDSTTMDQVLKQLLVTNGASRAEHRLRHADGRYVWLETTGRAVRDPVWGNVTELVTVSRDIEARKEAEDALRRSEEEYRVLFEANPLPMWAFDADSYKFIAVNDSAVSYYGYSRDEFLQMTILDIRPPEDAPAVRRKVEYIRAGFKDVHGSRHQKKDGSIMDVDLSVHQVKLSGRVTWLVLVKDITEATRTATALRASNEFIRALFDSSPVAIVATDLDLRVLQWNGAAERLFGWTEEEAIGALYPIASEAMWPEVHRNREQALHAGGLTDVQVQRRCKDGTPVDVSLSIGVIRNAELSPSGFVLLAADLSERAKLEAQLRHAQKMDAVGQLAAGVAHDFNNLLTVVTGYAGLLLTELPKDEAIRTDIEEIRSAAERAAVLTRQLLAFSRQQVLEPRVLDLNVVVEGMEQMLRRVLPADIKVVTVLAPSLGAINADPGQLEQVLMNLIVNARDAMPTGGTLTIETMDRKLDGVAAEAHAGAAHAGAARGDYVVLAVSDNGCGITKAVQSRIFEPFFTTKERGKGTGLGLSTAHGIVTQSGGFLSVYSEPGLGTTIKVCLPRVASKPDAHAAPEPVSTVAHGAEVILLVEDDGPVRLTATRILERAGYAVLSAADGEEALALHCQHASEIDLLVTDMIMPEMSGRELIARVRERDPEVAVLVMSGYTEHTSHADNFLEPGSVFIQKPFTPEALTAKVRSAINGRVSRPDTLTNRGLARRG